MTQRVAAESSFALAKGSVEGNGILGTTMRLLIPASRCSCSRYTMRHDLRKKKNTTALIYRCPMACHPCLTSQHFGTSTKCSTTRHHPHRPASHYREIPSPFDTPTDLPISLMLGTLQVARCAAFHLELKATCPTIPCLQSHRFPTAIPPLPSIKRPLKYAAIP